MGDMLLDQLSKDQALAMKEQFAGNETILTILNAHLEKLDKIETQAKAKAQFETQIAKLAAKLPHPEDIHNIYLAWREVEVEDTSQPQVEVDIVDQPARLDNFGKVVELATSHKEMRYPSHKVFRWVVETNKGFQVSKSTSTAPQATKRAITVKRIDGDNLIPVGNFPSASKACEYLKLTIGGDSATRVLAREGYLVQPYTGMDYTS